MISPKLWIKQTKLKTRHFMFLVILFEYSVRRNVFGSFVRRFSRTARNVILKGVLFIVISAASFQHFFTFFNIFFHEYTNPFKGNRSKQLKSLCHSGIWTPWTHVQDANHSSEMPIIGLYDCIWVIFLISYALL